MEPQALTMMHNMAPHHHLLVRTLEDCLLAPAKVEQHPAGLQLTLFV